MPPMSIYKLHAAHIHAAHSASNGDDADETAVVNTTTNKRVARESATQGFKRTGNDPELPQLTKPSLPHEILGLRKVSFWSRTPRLRTDVEKTKPKMSEDRTTYSIFLSSQLYNLRF